MKNQKLRWWKMFKNWEGKTWKKNIDCWDDRRRWGGAARGGLATSAAAVDRGVAYQMHHIHFENRGKLCWKLLFFFWNFLDFVQAGVHRFWGPIGRWIDQENSEPDQTKTTGKNFFWKLEVFIQLFMDDFCEKWFFFWISEYSRWLCTVPPPQPVT